MSSEGDQQKTGNVDEQEGDNIAKGGGDGSRRGRAVGRRLIYVLLLLLLLAGVAALVLYLIYRPSEPWFSVPTAAVYCFDVNASSPSVQADAAVVISTSLQFTVVAHNPNARASVSYDRLVVFATYGDHPITPAVRLPPMTQGEKCAVATSPVLGGGPVAVPVDVARGLSREAAAGVVGLRVVVKGRVKYRPGPFWSPWYGMRVWCDVVVGIRQGVYGQVPLLAPPDCRVDI